MKRVDCSEDLLDEKNLKTESLPAETVDTEDNSVWRERTRNISF